MPMIDVTGKIVVITGSLRPLTRQQAVVFLENQGAMSRIMFLPRQRF